MNETITSSKWLNVILECFNNIDYVVEVLHTILTPLCINDINTVNNDALYKRDWPKHQAKYIHVSIFGVEIKCQTRRICCNNSLSTM